MDFLTNLDLLSVAVAVAAIGVMGFSVYFNNRKSSTNRAFLLFSSLTIIWGISNFFEYKFTTIQATLYALKLHLFVSVWHALSFFQLSYVFPKEKIYFPKWYKFVLLPVVLMTSILTLTPFVFSGISELAPTGQVTNPERGMGIAVFGLVAFGLLISGISVLVRKMIGVSGVEKKQIAFVSTGMFLTACLILLFNFILPVTFNDLRFIPLAALFIFPFITLTSFTIYRHKLFKLKVIGVAVLTFVLSIVTFLEVIFSGGLQQILFRSGVFLLVLVIGILLIRGVLREIEQREKIEILAKDLEHTNADLNVANDRLKDLDKKKTEFLSFATHEIRKPLTAIKGYASLVLDGTMKGKKEIEDAVGTIFQASQSMATTVDNYLTISKIELGTVKYDFVAFDFCELLSETIKEMIIAIEKKGLAFNLDYDKKCTYQIVGDKARLKEVCVNLIDNAMKYTDSGSISVRLERKNDEGGNHTLLLSVRDTGAGISKEDMTKLFEKFSRGITGNLMNAQGSGLGLSLVKQIVEAHKGRVWVESDWARKGATFFVELPAA